MNLEVRTTHWLRLAAAAALGLAGIIVLSACGGEESDPLPPADATVVITMVDNAFEPPIINVKVGETVAVTVKNEGFAVHNMRTLTKSVEGRDFQSKQLVSPGEEDTFKLRFTTTGTFDFQCDYHLPDMVGKIVVE